MENKSCAEDIHYRFGGRISGVDETTLALIVEGMVYLPDEVVDFVIENVSFSKPYSFCPKDEILDRGIIILDDYLITKPKTEAVSIILHEIAHAFLSHRMNIDDDEWDRQEQEADNLSKKWYPNYYINKTQAQTRSTRARGVGLEACRFLSARHSESYGVDRVTQEPRIATSTPLEHSQALINAYNRRDAEALRSLLAPKLEYIRPEAITLTTPDEVMAQYEIDWATFERSRVDIRSYVEDEDTVAAEVTILASRERQDMVVEAVVFHQWRNGRLVRYRAYFDPFPNL